MPASGSGSQQIVAPNTAAEKSLAEIWCGVLGLNQVGIEDNFFDLGGTSILGLQMVARTQKKFGTNLRAVKLYQYPTIRALAEYLIQKKTMCRLIKISRLVHSDRKRHKVVGNG
jgi:acyl carrier protein